MELQLKGEAPQVGACNGEGMEGEGTGRQRR